MIKVEILDSETKKTWRLRLKKLPKIGHHIGLGLEDDYYEALVRKITHILTDDDKALDYVQIWVDSKEDGFN